MFEHKKIREISGCKRTAAQLLCLVLLSLAPLCQGCSAAYEEGHVSEAWGNPQAPGPAGTETEVPSTLEEFVGTDFGEAAETDVGEPVGTGGDYTVVSSDEILSVVPRFSGEAYVTLNKNIPGFTSEEKESREAFESYSDLDELGRCQTACANICPEIMPTEERGAIGQIKPSGWHLVKYDIVEGKYLYNRCHLIAYQLAGENANEKNLITGTRYFNVSGMLPFENKVADYVKETGNHVLYRITPVYQGDNLLAAGVQMEAYSLEDDGAGVCYNVFIYNCQPGISIDYATGESRLMEDDELAVPASETAGTEGEYVLNTNTKKFHLPSCSSVDEMKEKNKKRAVCSREELICGGYAPCKRCNP